MGKMTPDLLAARIDALTDGETGMLEALMRYPIFIKQIKKNNIDKISLKLAGGCVIFNEAGKVLLIKKTNGGFGFPKGNYERKSDCDRAATGVREAGEEAGVLAQVDPDRVDELNSVGLTLHVKKKTDTETGRQKYIGQITEWFLAEYKGENIEQYEGREVLWLTLQEAKSLLQKSYQRHVLEFAMRFRDLEQRIQQEVPDTQDIAA